jgi:aspartyl-tRNA(Asn)/glutamyl-tRNA(Gln) amidotransferase subunit A
VSDELLTLSAAEQAARIAAGEVSSAEVFEYWRGRAGADDLGAYLWVADEVPDDPGTLPPIAVKDLFCVRGVPSMAGSRILEGYRPPYTATSVRNLQDAGARVLGKTNQDEFAMGSSNENSGFGPVQNPWDRTRVPGGSSGGSAAAVASPPRCAASSA